MKRNYIIIIISLLLVIVFGFWLCFFQVRTTEVAVRTRFGNPIASLTNAGLYLKWPPPIERIYKFDNRTQSSEFESKLREDLTSDSCDGELQPIARGRTAAKHLDATRSPVR